MTVILRIDFYRGSDSTSAHLLSLTVTAFLHFVVRIRLYCLGPSRKATLWQTLPLFLETVDDVFSQRNLHS